MALVHEWTAHRLTDDESPRFDEDSFLLLHAALDDQTTTLLVAAAERHDDAFRSRQDVVAHQVLNLHDLIGRDPIFLDLVDRPETLPKVFGVLGWNIQCFHTQLVVTPPRAR